MIFRNIHTGEVKRVARIETVAVSRTESVRVYVFDDGERLGEMLLRADWREIADAARRWEEGDERAEQAQTKSAG